MKCLLLFISLVSLAYKLPAQSIGASEAGQYIGKTVDINVYVKSACKFPHSKSIVLALSGDPDQQTQLTLIVSLAGSNKSFVQFLLGLPGNDIEFTGKISGDKGHLVIRLTKETEIQESLPSYGKNPAATAAN